MKKLKFVLLTISMFAITSCYDFINPVFTSKDAQPLIDSGKYSVKFSKEFGEMMKGIAEQQGEKNKDVDYGAPLMDSEFIKNSNNTYKAKNKYHKDNKIDIQDGIITTKLFDNFFAYQMKEQKETKDKSKVEVNKIYIGQKNKKGFTLFMFDFEKASELIQKYKLKEVKKIKGKKVEMVYDGDKKTIVAFLKAHKNLKKTPMMVYEKLN